MKRYLTIYRALGACEICLLCVAFVVLAFVLSGCMDMPTPDPRLNSQGADKPTAEGWHESGGYIYQGSIRYTYTAEPYCVVNADKVYLRAGAGMNFEALTVTHKGDKLTLLDTGEWLHVRTVDNVTGYIYSMFCTIGG